MTAVPIIPTTRGSSPYDSSARPHAGFRAMFKETPLYRLPPCARISAPIASPCFCQRIATRSNFFPVLDDLLYALPVDGQRTLHDKTGWGIRWNSQPHIHEDHRWKGIPAHRASTIPLQDTVLRCYPQVVFAKDIASETNLPVKEPSAHHGSSSCRVDWRLLGQCVLDR